MRANLNLSASRWPAYSAAGALVLASAIMNARYGATLGKADLDKAVWIMASVGSDVLKAAAPVYLVLALQRRDWLRAFASVVLLAITISYSATAAIGFASAGRSDMAADRSSDTGVYERARASYEAAKAELPTLGNPGLASDLEARIAVILSDPRAGDCKELNGPYTRDNCPLVAQLRGDLAKAKRKTDLEAEMKAAQATLDRLPAPKEADPQAATMAAYINAITGGKLEAGDVQPVLVGIAAMLVELGSVLGFLMASGEVRKPALPVAELSEASDDKAPNASDDDKSGREAKAKPLPHWLRAMVETGELPEGAKGIEIDGKGRIRGTQADLARLAGKSKSAVNRELQRLADDKHIRLETGPTGTLISV